MQNLERELAIEICKIIDDKKGKDIVLMEVGKLASFADYFVIATGNSIKHTSALADEVEKRLGEKDILLSHKEGHREGSWILLDYLDVVIHIFTEEQRSFYDIERIWKGAKYVELDIDMD